MSWWAALAEGVNKLVDVGAGIEARNDSQEHASYMLDRQAEIAREFAQQGVRWKVDDAKAAGIHPLFALGAQPMSFQASYQGGEGGQPLPLGDLARSGVDIARAVDGTRTESERVTARMDALALERAELQNDLLRSQIARLNVQQTPPTPGSAYLMPGQTSSGVVVDKPLERVGGAPEAPSQEPGAITDVGFARTETGLAPVPSGDVKQRIEDSLIPETLWSLRNLLLPRWAGGASNAPPVSALPPGAYRWTWHPGKFEWQPDYRSPEDYHGRPDFRAPNERPYLEYRHLFGRR